MAKHTPGPWDADLTPMPSGPMWVICTDRGALADVYGLEANARLIAASPDLLQALRELVAEADEPVGWDGHPHRETTGFQFARAAIAKAEGGK